MTGCPRCQSPDLARVDEPGEWHLDVLECLTCGHRWAVN